MGEAGEVGSGRDGGAEPVGEVGLGEDVSEEGGYRERLLAQEGEQLGWGVLARLEDNP